MGLIPPANRRVHRDAHTVLGSIPEGRGGMARVADTLLTMVEVSCRGSSFPCFDGKGPDKVLSKLRDDLSKAQTVAFALDLGPNHDRYHGTKQYDYFQYLSQGIAT